jgi:serine/threonine protein phosphatase 1
MASAGQRQPGASHATDDQTCVLYGVGDVHGMHDLLGNLLAEIEADTAAHGLPSTLVFLGDLVDRGPATKLVIDRLMAGPSRPEDQWVVLRGNHEQAMLDALVDGDDAAFHRWLRIGGKQTLASYGHTSKRVTPRQARDLIGERHLGFLMDLPLTHVSGGYLFVHAGVEPGVPLRKQQPADLLAIRKRFLKKPHGLPFTVVHGHTPTDGHPLMGPGRIGVDTGAYMTGILTAVAIEQGQSAQRFLNTRTPTRSHPGSRPSVGR